jgi:hypothetical protein
VLAGLAVQVFIPLEFMLVPSGSGLMRAMPPAVDPWRRWLRLARVKWLLASPRRFRSVAR